MARRRLSMCAGMRVGDECQIARRGRWWRVDEMVETRACVLVRVSRLTRTGTLSRVVTRGTIDRYRTPRNWS